VWGATRDTVVEALQSDRPILLNLHGDVEDAATRILTGSEYDAHYVDLIAGEAAMKPLSRLIQRVLESRRVPCVGCSLQDDRIVTILNNAASRMDAFVHYAIVPALASPWSESRNAIRGET
jgi:hypothetical protein